MGDRDGVAQDDVVLVERRDGVVVITLNRPEVKNALDGRVARAVAGASAASRSPHPANR
jgi:enoyl-CoA hydratase/carnithine racemase